MTIHNKSIFAAGLTIALVALFSTMPGTGYTLKALAESIVRMQPITLGF